MELLLVKIAVRYRSGWALRHDIAQKLRRPKKHYQLDLFSPNNGIYEYSAVVADTKAWKAEDLLLFVSGRSAQENSISELKTSFAFDHIPTNTYQANSAYLQISQMAYNLATSMQHNMGLTQPRKTNKKFTRLHKIMEWRTFRLLILNRAGRIVRENGYKVLQMTENPETKSLYEKISHSLEKIKLKKAA